MENKEYSYELKQIETIFDDEEIEEELGYAKDHEYYED